MPSRTEAPVTPDVMKWAREKAGMDVALAAHKIKRPAEDIRAWESGDKRPSLAQLRQAAKVYKRSLAVFFLSQTPKDFDTLRDFRHLPAELRREYSPELALTVRQMLVRQEWTRDYHVQEGDEPLAFIGSARVDSDVAKTAAAIRNALGIDDGETRRCKGHREALNLWIGRAERQRIYICRHGGIEPEEARGLVLSDDYAPFVFVNSADAVAAQLFTLVHELAHLWIGQPGISNLAGLDEAPDSRAMQAERHCNRVAAETLVDTDSFRQVWRQTTGPDSKRIEAAARQFWVSEETIARKLLDQGVISHGRYRDLRIQYRERWSEVRGARRGRGNYYHNTSIKNSRRFTRTVISAYYGGRVTGREASGLLGAKIGHFRKLASESGGSMFMGGHP